MTRIASICRVHGFFKGICPQCEAAYTQAARGRRKLDIMVNTSDWVKKGEYEHIDPQMPHMKFDSKEDLKKECEKRGLLVKCLMKPKSQGKGWEHAKR